MQIWRQKNVIQAKNGNPSICTSECDNYTENIIDDLLITYENETLNDTIIPNTSLGPKNIFFIVIIASYHHCMYKCFIIIKLTFLKV